MEVRPMTDTTTHLDERLRRPSGIRSLTLGATKLSYVPDGQATLNARMMLPEVTDEFWAQHAEYLDEGGFLMASVGGLLVERDGRALLIDAGVGPISVGPPLNTFGVQTGGKLLDSLATLGRSPADIEAVALTHLHNDHFGWAWYPAPGSDRPAFAGTDILVAEPEWTQRRARRLRDQRRRAEGDRLRRRLPHPDPDHPPALAERLRLRPPAVHQPPPRPHRRARPARHHRLRHPPRRHALRPRPHRGQPSDLAPHRRLRTPDHTGPRPAHRGPRAHPRRAPARHKTAGRQRPRDAVP